MREKAEGLANVRTGHLQFFFFLSFTLLQDDFLAAPGSVSASGEGMYAC